MVNPNLDFNNKYLIKLIVPLVVEQLLAVLVGFIDTLMISTVGEYAISGVALVDNINRLAIQVLAAFATGGVVVVSQYLGRGDEERSRLCTGQLLTLMMVSTVVISAILILFPRQILGVIFGGVDADVMEAAVTYLVVTSFSYPFLAIYNAGAAIYRSFGNSSISMRISVVMNIANVALNAMLVFYMNLGVLGVALATLFSRAISCVIMATHLGSSSNQLRPHSLSAFLPKAKYIAKILKIGIPSGVENSMFQIGKLVVVGMVAKLGTSAIAANSVATQIIDFPNLPATSIGIALITIVSQCVGAGRIDEARRQTKRLMKYAYVSDWISKGLLFIFAPQLVSWFSLTDDTAATAVLVLRSFFIAAIVAWPMSFTLPNALRAAGDARYTMTVSILSMWVCRIAASYFLVFNLHMGIMGVWVGMYVDWYIRAFFYLIRYLGNRWSRHQVI